jgi:hypothetical protein
MSLLRLQNSLLGKNQNTVDITLTICQQEPNEGSHQSVFLDYDLTNNEITARYTCSLAGTQSSHKVLGCIVDPSVMRCGKCGSRFFKSAEDKKKAEHATKKFWKLKDSVKV